MRFEVGLRNVARLVLLSLAGLLCALRATGGPLQAHARALDRLAAVTALPYWYDTAIDRAYGGYLLAADARRLVPAANEKQLVTQTRMLWAFSRAHAAGYRDPQRDYLAAARQGYDFILRHFRDRDRGGYIWKTDLQGAVLSDRKFLYGQAFVVYAFVEYARASGDGSALGQALELFKTVQRECHDAANSGWDEQFTRDWRRIDLDQEPMVERAKLRSANAHLHWMEALTELYGATRDEAVRRALVEAIRVNDTYFFCADEEQAALYRNRDWSRPRMPENDVESFGHEIEYAWLLLRACDVLGRPRRWNRFDEIVTRALRRGLDEERGGLAQAWDRKKKALDRRRIWWVESELLCALTESVRARGGIAPARELDRLVHYLTDRAIDQRTGAWYAELAPDGTVRDSALAHEWKGAYHELRAVMKFVEAFR